jgi:ketosteroid isomerase-like protein
MRRILITVALLCAPSAANAQGAPERAVAEVVHAYHDALAAGDSTGALQLLHPDVVIYEGGHAETLDEYRSGHLRSDMAFASATQRAVTAESAMAWGDEAMYIAESRTTGRWRDRDIDSQGTETVVLLRTPDGWRIRHIHWSSR